VQKSEKLNCDWSVRADDSTARLFVNKNNKKSPTNAKGTRDSDAYVKARCEQNLSSHFTTMFYLDSTANDA